MKRLGIVNVLLIVLLGVGLFGGASWWNQNTKPLSQVEDFQSIIIPRGKSASWIGEKLYDEGLIKSPLVFKVYVQVLGKQANINAGQFRLSPSMSLAEIVQTLQGGPLELWVTVPEGLRREQIVEIFIDGLDKPSEDAGIFREEFLLLTVSKEGYLFPDTYLFPPEASASAVVNKLSSTFELKIDDEILTGISRSGYTKDQVVTVASIIERETKTDEERPIVAGILWKRLETEGWYVQADATNQYAAGSAKCKVQSAKCDDWWPTLTLDDIEKPSSYNSYTNFNLPPTPIANPGLSSISAAVFPEESSYWFYIHDPGGNIHYAETLREHNENIRVYLGK